MLFAIDRKFTFLFVSLGKSGYKGLFSPADILHITMEEVSR